MHAYMPKSVSTISPPKYRRNIHRYFAKKTAEDLTTKNNGHDVSHRYFQLIHSHTDAETDSQDIDQSKFFSAAPLTCSPLHESSSTYSLEYCGCVFSRIALQACTASACDTPETRTKDTGICAARAHALFSCQSRRQSNQLTESVARTVGGVQYLS